jgi:uncharacterized membrane protein YqaE (UPF0057 family)
LETVVVAKTVETPVASKISPVKEFISEEMKAQTSPVKHSDKTSAMAAVSKDNFAPANTIKPIKFNQSVLTGAKGKSDGNLILMVILCLFPFINLIAIYMHDSGVTTNFWITLLLDVLFFLPGIIFALLVVLDVVNLA